MAGALPTQTGTVAIFSPLKVSLKGENAGYGLDAASRRPVHSALLRGFNRGGALRGIWSRAGVPGAIRDIGRGRLHWRRPALWS